MYVPAVGTLVMLMAMIVGSLKISTLHTRQASWIAQSHLLIIRLEEAVTLTVNQDTGQVQAQCITQTKMCSRIVVYMTTAKTGILMTHLMTIVPKSVLNAGSLKMSNTISDGMLRTRILRWRYMESTEPLHSPSKKTTHVK